MPRKNHNLVLSIALSDRESFKVLPDKKTQKRIYDKIRNRLTRQGFENGLLETKMKAEIREELFNLQKPFKPKSDETKPKIDESEPKRKSISPQDNFVIHGVDIWEEHVPEIDPIDRELEIWEKNSENYMNQFCSKCRSNPCMCREGDE